MSVFFDQSQKDVYGERAILGPAYAHRLRVSYVLFGRRKTSEREREKIVKTYDHERSYYYMETNTHTRGRSIQQQYNMLSGRSQTTNPFLRYHEPDERVRVFAHK
jgi:hypothetical protein